MDKRVWIAVLPTPLDLVGVTTFDLSSPPIIDSEVGDTPRSMSTIAWSNLAASNLSQLCLPCNHHQTQLRPDREAIELHCFTNHVSISILENQTPPPSS